MKRKKVVVTLLIVALNVSLTQNVLAEENVASINEALETENTKSELQDAEESNTELVTAHTKGKDIPKTVISREFSSEWKPGDEPYYPVNDKKNGDLYVEYKKLADAEERVIFGGRLGEYKYYDMDAVIASALDMCERELQ